MISKRKTLEYIQEREAEGKVSFMTIEGLTSCKLEDFIKQPAEGMLYDLNRDKITVLTASPEARWINDYAVAVVIQYVMSLLDGSTPNQPSKSQFRRVSIQTKGKTDKIIKWIKGQSWGYSLMIEITKQMYYKFHKDRFTSLPDNFLDTDDAFIEYLYEEKL